VGATEPEGGGRRGLRVLLAKVGLDGHDRGVKVVGRLLRDSGHEVIYLGRRQECRAVVQTAIHEDVDVLGVSILSGTHATVIAELMQEIARARLDVPVVVGGTILRQEVPGLLAQGVARVFPVGTPLAEIRDYFADLTARRAAAPGSGG